MTNKKTPRPIKKTLNVHVSLFWPTMGFLVWLSYRIAILWGIL